jgi:hypothetical protein
MYTTSDELSQWVDDSHVETPAKVIDYVHRMEDKLGRPRSHKDQIMWQLQERKRFPAKRSRGDLRQHYYFPCYANHFGQYQIDLLVQSAQKTRQPKYPPYFFIAINTNTRYAYAFPLKNNKRRDLLEVLNKLIQVTQVRSLVSDQEPALTSDEVADWAERNEITYHFIPDQNHTALGIIDRFIRTLRDMNTPSYNSVKNSDDPEFRDFTPERMEELIELYNNHIHSSLGMSPADMEKHPDIQQAYIVQKLFEVHERKKIADFDLPMGTWVQFIVPHDVMEKHRYQVTPEVYQVKAKAGNHYVIMAKDGATRTIPRWQLLPVPESEVRKHIRVGTTFGLGRTGMVKRVSEPYPRGADINSVQTYNVEWEMPDGEPPSEQRTTVAKIRANQPNKGPSREEREYWNLRRRH